jgi:hypothetical protein
MAVTVSSVSPAQGPSGTLVIITGTGFSPDTVRRVQFGTVDAGSNFQVVDDTAIACLVPYSASGGTVSITVYDDSGSGSGGTFLYDANVGDPGSASGSAPTVTGVSPSTATTSDGGDAVTITGTGFTTALAVYFGSVQASFVVNSDTSITATAPPGSGTVDVSVTNPYGTSAITTADQYTYPTVPIPTVSSIFPTSGGGGEEVTVTGTNFDYAESVTFGSEFAQFVIESSTTITAIAPSGTPGSTVDVLVTSIGGTSADPGNANNFTYSTTTVTSITATPGTGFIAYSWVPINIRGVRYEAYCSTATDPAYAATVTTPFYLQKTASPTTSYYFKVRAIGPNGEVYAFSATIGPYTSKQDAADLADAAIANAKLAPGLRPPPLLATAPTDFSAYPSGAYYYNTTNKTLYVSNGSSWSVATLSNAVLGKVVSGTIEAGAIGATELAANSVYAKNLVVADYENLVQNSNSEADPTGKDTSYNSADIEFRGVDSTYSYAGSRARRRVGGGTGVKNTIELCNPVPCKVGDAFSLTAKARMDIAEASYGCRVEIYGLKSNGTEVTLYQPGTSNPSISGYTGTTSFADLSVKAVVAAGGTAADTPVSVGARLCVNATSGHYGYFDQILFRKNLSGSLIVDGEITGTIFTGGKFRTAPSGRRIETDSTTYEKLSLYSGADAETTPAYITALDAGGGAVFFQMSGPNVNGKQSSFFAWASSAQSYCELDSDIIVLDGYTSITRHDRLARKASIIEEDFTKPSTNYANGVAVGEFVNAAIGGGLASSENSRPTIVASTVDHPGAVKHYSASSAANSGWGFRTATSSGYGLKTYDVFECSFLFPSVASTVRARVGVMNAWTESDPTGGAWCSFVGNGSNVIATGYVNGTATGGSCTLAVNTYYTLVVDGTSDGFEFNIYDESGVQQTWLSNAVPDTSPAISAFGYVCYNTSAANVWLFQIDYLGLSISERNR